MQQSVSQFYGGQEYKRILMKHILIIRHAKSSWAEIGQRDFDRPLNERGLRDAPEMAKRLVNKNISIDLFISSEAKRALTTSKLMMKEMKMREDQLIVKKDLYHAPPSVILSSIQQSNDQFDSIAIVCHNPGITEFANIIQGLSIDNVPTCGMLALQSDVAEWEEVSIKNLFFDFFDYPKK
jgi:phosphohistidine phosphatase